jgi:hypothetical protein
MRQQKAEQLKPCRLAEGVEGGGGVLAVHVGTFPELSKDGE